MRRVVTNPSDEPPRRKRQRLSIHVPHRAKVHKDADGYHFIVPADAECARVDVWWNRGPTIHVGRRKVIEERLVVRQMDGEASADVVLLTQGQLYDIIDAFNMAVERP
jgi:hypothetical protein